MKIVITGFEPFGNDNLNSSGEVAGSLCSVEHKEFTLNTFLLPVSFRKVGGILRRILTDTKPDVMIMLGQAGNCSEIRLERVAINFMDANIPDNDGFKPEETEIDTYGDSAYFCNLPLKKLNNALRTNCIESKISNTAGTYVCNCAYYNALKTVRELDIRTHIIFVHLPLLLDQEIAHPGKHYSTLENLRNIVKTLADITADIYNNTDNE